MNETTTEAFKTLKESPLFNLSLSSKELFHSNMFYWICETYGDILGPILAKKIGIEAEHIEETKREKFNTDLIIHFKENKKVVIENKVKSIPNPAQLKKYEQSVRGIDKFVLLSLLRPNFEAVSTNWKHFDYSDYGKILEELISGLENGQSAYTNKPNLAYHLSLLKDYTKFIAALVAITETITIDFENGLFDFHKNHSQYQEIRLHDLYTKRIYSLILSKLTQLLPPEKDNWHTHINYLNGKGIISIEYRAHNSILGIMIDGHRYLHFIRPSDQSDQNAIAKELLDEGKWLNPNLKKDELQYPKAPKDFNKYGLMLYRSVKIPSDFPLKDFLNIIEKDFRLMMQAWQ